MQGLDRPFVYFSRSWVAFGTWHDMLVSQVLFSPRNLLLVTLASVILSACASKNSNPAATDRLKECTSVDGLTDAYCGTLEVFENRATKAGRKIKLRVVVLQGLARNSAPDPLFFLAGGPGQGAAKLAKTVREMFRSILNDRDIVLVDQRGTGDSHPLDCKFDAEKVDEKPEAANEKLKNCLAGYDADPSLYTTTIAMDDLDEVRAYLGYNKINLYGGSYGTRAAIEYVRRHADHTRAVILDGVAPPDMGLPLYMARDGQRAFDLLARDCQQDPTCNRRFPNLKNRFQSLMDRLEKQPQKVKITHPRTGATEDVEVTRALASGIVFTALYAPQYSALLPLLVERAEANDFQGLLTLGGMGESIAGNMSIGMRYSVVCAEDSPRVTAGSIQTQTAGTFMGAKMVEQFLKPCQYWPKGKVEPAFYEPFHASVPTLVLSGELDPVTPPIWGDQIAKHWKNTKHVVVPGSGHGTISRGCVTKMARDFLKTADIASVNPACVQELKRSPFFLGYSGPDAGTTKADSK